MNFDGAVLYFTSILKEKNQPYNNRVNLQRHLIEVQAALDMCGLFICDFTYMRSRNDLFFWNLSSNYQSSLVFLYANSLYASLFLESLSLAYNEVQLYFYYFRNDLTHMLICINSLFYMAFKLSGSYGS